jgi:hypothetical protein
MQWLARSVRLSSRGSQLIAAGGWIREWFAVTRSTFYSWRKMKLQIHGMGSNTSKHRCMSLLSSPPSLSSDGVLCLAVDSRKQGKGMLDLLLNGGWTQEWFAVTRSTFYSWEESEELQFTGWVWTVLGSLTPLQLTVLWFQLNTTRQEKTSNC